MNKSDIEKRIAELQIQKDMALANANANAGAIEDCKYWLKIIDDAEKAKSQNSENSL